MKRLPMLAAAALLASLAACGPSASSSAGAPASSLSASAPPPAPANAAGGSPSAGAASAKACAELRAWQKEHGNSAAPSQDVSTDLMGTPEPLSGDFIAWDLAVSTSQPGAEADLLKVWTDCAKAEAAALGA